MPKSSEFSERIIAIDDKANIHLTSFNNWSGTVNISAINITPTIVSMLKKSDKSKLARRTELK